MIRFSIKLTLIVQEKVKINKNKISSENSYKSYLQNNLHKNKTKLQVIEK